MKKSTNPVEPATFITDLATLVRTAPLLEQAGKGTTDEQIMRAMKFSIEFISQAKPVILKADFNTAMIMYLYMISVTEQYPEPMMHFMKGLIPSWACEFPLDKQLASMNQFVQKYMVRTDVRKSMLKTISALRKRLRQHDFDQHLRNFKSTLLEAVMTDGTTSEQLERCKLPEVK